MQKRVNSRQSPGKVMPMWRTTNTHRQKSKEVMRVFPLMGLSRQPGHWWHHLATAVRVGLIQLRGPWSPKVATWTHRSRNHNSFPGPPGLPEPV